MNKIKDNLKLVVYGIISLVLMILTVFLLLKSLFSFAIVTGTFLIISIVLFVRGLIFFKNSCLKFKNYLSTFIRTYDSVLIECDNLPSLNDKNIILINDIDELIDAQLEIKKPIYYKVFDHGCAFVLIDGKEGCVSIVKENPYDTLEYENEVHECINRNKQNCINGAILEDLDKTTIIKLGNKKELKVSPIRKKSKNSDSLEVLDDVEVL